jgi:MOSC domain-containing protein YiiM
VGNADRSRRRQVTIIEREVWDRLMSQLDASTDPAVRRANLLVSGIGLVNTRGCVLRIGETRLVIDGETTPCERMEEAVPGLEQAMRREWGGGAFAQVLTGGVIRIGDEIELEVGCAKKDNSLPAANSESLPAALEAGKRNRDIGR